MTLTAAAASEPSTEQQQQPDPPRDEEGLLLEYDVILCGTGLVNSILASALARAGKSVLHCDAADYYGELDAVWTLPYLQQRWKNESTVHHEEAESEKESRTKEDGSIPISPRGACRSLRIHSMETKRSFPITTVGTAVATPYGTGKVTGWTEPSSDDLVSLTVSLTSWQLANGSHPVVFAGMLEGIRAQADDASVADYLAQTHKIRSVAAVAAHTILEERSRSLALDVSPGLVYCVGSAVSGLIISSVADYLEFKSLEGLLYLEDSKLQRVPCSKNDVFSSKLLSPMDKRRLMKFLQLAFDYATAEESKDEKETVSESSADTVVGQSGDVQSLNERRLNQGRSLARPQNKAVSTDDMELLQQCIVEDMDFETYLAEKQRLSPKLRALVRYALALESSGQKTASTLQQGMKHLCHHMLALGRFGATAFLVPLYGSGEMPQAFCRSAAVYGATYLLRRAPLRIVTEKDKVQGVVIGGDTKSESKLVHCSHAIVPQEAMMTMQTSSKRVLRRISVLRGKPIRSEFSQQQRHVVIIPPGSFGNANAIQALLLDEAVNVAPHVSGGCTVVHLTTVADEEKDDHIDDGVLKAALDSILSNGKEGVDEIFHISFSYALSDRADSFETDGIHVVHRPEPCLDVDAAFDQAKDIFDRICPAVEFLTMSKEMDSAVKERLGDRRNEEDDERMVLESAMGMIDKPSTEVESSSAQDTSGS